MATRQLLYCVVIPAETDWVKEVRIKLLRKMRCHCSKSEMVTETMVCFVMFIIANSDSIIVGQFRASRGFNLIPAQL